MTSSMKSHRALDTKVVYRRYASLFFVCGIGLADNELVTLEVIHRFVEVLDRYFGNVSYYSLQVFFSTELTFPSWQVCELDL